MNCMAERLTATPTGCGHLAACRQAVRNTHSPSGRIKSGFLRQGNEIGWRDHAALGKVPAHQGLETRHLAGLQIMDRLVVDLELGIGDGLAKVELERAARNEPHLALKSVPDEDFRQSIDS